MNKNAFGVTVKPSHMVAPRNHQKESSQKSDKPDLCDCSGLLRIAFLPFFFWLCVRFASHDISHICLGTGVTTELFF